MKRLLLLFTVLFPLAVSAQWEYRGTIGKDLNIWMRLETYADTAFGGYFYTSSGEEIKLYGNGNDDKGYSLKEVNSDGKVTAILTFKKTARYDTYEGTWKPVNKKKKPLPIKVFMLPPNIGIAGAPPEPIYFQKDSIVKRSKKELYDIKAYYPQFTFEDGYGRAQFNALIKSYVEESVDSALTELGMPDDLAGDDISSGFWMNYTIADTPGFVSVEFDTYFLLPGAAHGMYMTAPKIYSGRLHRMVELQDLFKPGAKYLEVLSDLCVQAVIDSLTARGNQVDDDLREYIEEGAAPVKENFEAFIPTRYGLWIIFDPYEVAPYAAGTIRVFIPYKKLEDILTDDWEVRRWKRY